MLQHGGICKNTHDAFLLKKGERDVLTKPLDIETYEDICEEREPNVRTSKGQENNHRDFIPEEISASEKSHAADQILRMNTTTESQQQECQTISEEFDISDPNYIILPFASSSRLSIIHTSSMIS